MNKQDVKNRVAKLREEINYYRHEYHVNDRSEISDAALDSLKNELQRLEQENPELITPDSPTQRVGGAPLDKFSKVRHTQPMMSLFDAFNEQDMIDWEKRNKNILDKDFEYFVELKVDGLAMSLRYERGIFGIGAGRFCDGQVQVVNDLLGLSPKIYRHARAYVSARESFTDAMKTYAGDVRSGRFPEEKNAISVPEEVVRAALSGFVDAGEQT